jgi:hypothetical protein
MTTLEGLFKAVLSVGFAPRLYNDDPRMAEEFSEGLAVESSSTKKAEMRWCYS